MRLYLFSALIFFICLCAAGRQGFFWFPDAQAQDSDAVFRGGESEWKSYLDKNLDRNVPVAQGAPVGSYVVSLKFMIGTDGKILQTIAETNFGYGMEDELRRVMLASPAWIPAHKDGKAVKAFKRQSITYVVEER